MNYKKVFIRLLKDIGCYQIFFINFRKLNRYICDFNDSDISLDHFIELSVKRNSNTISFKEGGVFYYLINDAFNWSKTNEGFEYWSHVSHKMKDVGRYMFNGIRPTECIYSLKEIEELRKIVYGEEKS